MKCLACMSPDLRRLWIDPDGFQWHRCETCGSDTSEATYDPERYGQDYIDVLMHEDAGEAVEHHEHNVQMFERHAQGRGLFLDVGCGHGAGLAAMWSAGWETLGWDVTFAGRPRGIVMSPEFRANLFWQRFDAVLCREVLEHIPDGHRLLRELFEVTRPGGLCQLTTPKPMASLAECKYLRCYQWAHLCLWHPDRLRDELESIGFAIVECEIWELGQRYLMRKPT